MTETENTQSGAIPTANAHADSPMYVRWFIRLRWVGIGLLGLGLGAAHVIDVRMPTQLTSLVVLAIVTNCVWSVGLRRFTQKPLLHIMVQAVVDVLILSVLIHFSGGIDNPLQLLFVLQVAIVSIILPRRRVLVVVGTVVLVHNGLIVSEAVGLLSHHPLPLGEHAEHDMAGNALWQQPEFLVAYVVAFSATILGVVYLVGGLVSRLEESTQLRLNQQRLDMARERLARIGTLSSGVAHAIRNPIHGMFNCLEILGDRPQRPAGDVELLGLMHEGLTRIERITRRLLSMSREAPLDLRETSLNLVVDEAARLSSVRAREQKVVSTVGEHPCVLLDSDRFVEALSNIIDNALDASPPGGTVEIWCDSDAEGIELVVQDQGEGIATELMARVLDPFFSTKAIGEGSGLGLAIASEIVEAHGFVFSLSSEAGRGTSVRITIPSNLTVGRHA